MHAMQMHGQWGLLWLFVLAVLFASASAFGSSATVVIGGFHHLCRPRVGWDIAAGNSGVCWVYAQVVFIHCFHPHRWCSRAIHPQSGHIGRHHCHGINGFGCIISLWWLWQCLLGDW